MRTTTRILVALLVIAVAIAGVSTTGLANGGESADATSVGSFDLVVENEHVHVSDVEVAGDGLPTAEIDERTVEIESATVEADGVTATFRGTTYEFGEVSIGVENVGVTLEDVSVGGSE